MGINKNERIKSMKRMCKYCNSEMDLMESYPNYEFWCCMNEDCEASLTIDEKVIIGNNGIGRSNYEIQTRKHKTIYNER